MQWIERHIETAENICINYTGSIPLQHELKNYFSKNKKHGSRDRKIISHLCYTYFRLGKALISLAFKERLQVALFLCEEKLDKWQPLFQKDMLAAHGRFLEDRIAFIQKKYHAFSLNDVFIFDNYIGDIDRDSFIKSIFIQPLTFLRSRPGKHKKVMHALHNQDISFAEINETAIGLQSGINLQEAVRLNKDAVVQDSSSQKITAFFELIDKNFISTIWDCCAASGGKTILAYDYFSKAAITVSDIRQSIIANLKKRLREAGVSYKKAFIADVTQPMNLNEKFDLIICDAPCSGSGTWARTPEQLSYFKEEKINEYTALQSTILKNIQSYTVSGGYLLYITCSVFKQENENQVDDLLHLFPGLRLIKSDYIVGYNDKADTMYAALLKKD